MMFVLDSSAIIEVLGGSQLGAEVRDIVDGWAATTTSISYVEVMSGTTNKTEAVAEQLFACLTLLDFTVAAAKKSLTIAKALREKGRMVEWSDIFIAGICKNENAILVTCDQGFKHIPGIEIKLVGHKTED